MKKNVSGIKFTTKKEKGFIGEAMYADGKYITNVATIDEFEKEIADYIEIHTEKSLRLKAGAKTYTHAQIAELFEEYCKERGIAYSTNYAMSSSIYISAIGKTFRFADHAKPAEARSNFYYTYNADMPSGLLLKSEIISAFENALK